MLDFKLYESVDDLVEARTEQRVPLLSAFVAAAVMPGAGVWGI